MQKYFGMPITVDTDDTMGYETNSVHKKLFNLIATPILNNAPASLHHLIKRSDKSANHVLENRTTHEALETLYACGHSHPDGNLLQSIFRSIWFNIDNSKAVRNRLKLVKREIMTLIKRINNQGRKVRLLSIASGSARSVIEATKQSGLTGNSIELSFLDKNPNAIDYSKRLVTEYTLPYHCLWFIDIAQNFPNYFSVSDEPNVIEMVGLLDYFSIIKTLDLLKIIYANLATGGYLVTANISDNRERMFITNIVGWQMDYKSADELLDLAIKAGFKSDKISVMYEPLKIHCVLVAQK